MSKPRCRLAVDTKLSRTIAVMLSGNQAHYLTQVLRLGVGEAVLLFNREEGEWLARITQIRKKEVMLAVEECLRPPRAGGMNLMVCFAPVKGGRVETIIEKATELGASLLQPVISQRTIVDKVNLSRAEAIAREAAEQCERIDWPEIREPVKLLKLLSDWPANMPLIYGDETGAAPSINELASKRLFGQSEAERESFGGKGRQSEGRISPPSINKNWAILAGPEGGFAPEEFAALGQVKEATGVGLGPRILRADTAVITLCVATLQLWGDWASAPRFVEGKM